MKKIILAVLFLAGAFLQQGCLVFHKMSYIIDLDSPEKGKATVFVYDIMSNPMDDTEFNTDKTNLFEYSQKSKDFLKQMSEQGRNIKTRDLFLSGDTLNAKVTFTFDDLSKIEGIAYEDGFYYLTLTPEDSVLSTNGEVIKSKEYKRILWDNSVKQLRFEMLGFDKREPEFKPLSGYFKQNK